MYSSQIVYERIDKMLACKNKSMSELNKVCGMSKNTVSQSAASQDGMKARRLFTIANFLDCSVDYLLGRTDNPMSHKSNVSVSTGHVSNNSGAIGVGNVITGNDLSLDGQKSALIKIFDELDAVSQAKMLVYADSLKTKS